MNYAGIGSRKTPLATLLEMTKWGEFLAWNDVRLRSGHALGADQAFERGCNKANPAAKRIYTTADFDNNDAHLQAMWLGLAAQFHPAWDRCNDHAKKLHARNSPIILGEFLNEPIDFVVCWTERGAISGGTGQALRIANAYRIPVFNFGNGIERTNSELKRG